LRRYNRSFLKSLIRGIMHMLPLFVCLSFFSCSNEPIQKPIDKPSIDSIIQEGDIIIKCGHGQISRLITKTLDEEIDISHSAILIKEKGELALLHSVSGTLAETDGVQKISLKKFLTDVKKGTFFILRPEIDSTKTQLVVSQALSKLEEDIPFDHEFNNADSTEFYCSEFIQFIFEEGAGISCFETKSISEKDIYMFNSIFSNPNFKVIYKW